MESNIHTSKSNPFLLSNKVKSILEKKGYTSIFNFTDYKVFKNQCRMAFNKSQAIAKKFIEEAEPNNNDYNEYLF